MGGMGMRRDGRWVEWVCGGMGDGWNGCAEGCEMGEMSVRRDERWVEWVCGGMREG